MNMFLSEFCLWSDEEKIMENKKLSGTRSLPAIIIFPINFTNSEYEFQSSNRGIKNRIDSKRQLITKPVKNWISRAAVFSNPWRIAKQNIEAKRGNIRIEMKDAILL